METQRIVMDGPLGFPKFPISLYSVIGTNFTLLAFRSNRFQTNVP